MIRAVVYSRISKEEQSVFSLEKQVEECKEFIHKEGYEFVQVYIEDGISAKTMKRPQLQQMLQDMNEGKFDMIVVWRLDRLTRTTLDGLTMVINMFKPNGIEFASVTEDIDTSTSDGMMMFTIRLSMAQNEREKIAERVSLGQRARAEKGKRNTSARPYGYDVGEDLMLAVNEEEARIVKQIYDWYIKGWGRIKIARTLIDWGVPANRGGDWQEKIIGDILKNPTYTGAIHYKPKKGKQIIVPNVHEAIIPQETFDQAQNIFIRRREHDMNLSSHDFIYSTIVKCAQCGRSYHGKMKTFSDPKRKQYRYYRCSGKYRPGLECDASDIVETKLTDMLFSIIDLNTQPYQDKPIIEQTIDVEKERKRLEKQLNDSKERRKKWSRAMGDGKLSYEEFSELVDEEKKKSARWEEELSKLPKQSVQTGRSQKDVAERLKRLKADWESIDNMDRKIIIQGLFKRIVIMKIAGEWKIVGYELA
jgi:site-specific DNA recombinase